MIFISIEFRFLDKSNKLGKSEVGNKISKIINKFWVGLVILESANETRVIGR